MSIAALAKAFETMHGCKAVHVSTAQIKETFNGRTVWEGEVEVFNITGHPRAFQCYAWSYQDDEGRTQVHRRSKSSARAIAAGCRQSGNTGAGKE